MIKNIAIFCGSSPGNKPVYIKMAEELAKEMHRRGYGLVYGGAKVGLMGVIADEILNAGGKVTGVMPEHLVRKEVLHEGLGDLYIVKNMHERKGKISEISDAFIAMPGGYGTLDEFFEALTWLQLELHSKPCALYNINGFFDKLMEFIDRASEDMFINSIHRELIIIDDNPVRLLEKMEDFIPPKFDKAAWIKQMSDITKGNK